MSDFPRRVNMSKWTPAERAINDAIQAVEAMPADERLTNAVMLLGAAQEKVADFVDATGEPSPSSEDVTAQPSVGGYVCKGCGEYIEKGWFHGCD
jgi:hypothetical protein